MAKGRRLRSGKSRPEQGQDELAQRLDALGDRVRQARLEAAIREHRAQGAAVANPSARRRAVAAGAGAGLLAVAGVTAGLVATSGSSHRTGSPAPSRPGGFGRPGPTVGLSAPATSPPTLPTPAPTLPTPAPTLPPPSQTLPPPPTPVPPSQPQPAVLTVRPGQSFWSIAEAVVSTRVAGRPTPHQVGHYWARLIEANVSHLPVPGDPDLIFAGTDLVLPSGD